MSAFKFMEAAAISKDSDIKNACANLTVPQLTALARLFEAVSPLPEVSQGAVRDITEGSVSISSIPISSVAPKRAPPKPAPPHAPFDPHHVADMKVVLKKPLTTKDGRLVQSHNYYAPCIGEDGKMRNYPVGSKIGEAMREFVMQPSLWKYWGFEMMHFRKEGIMAKLEALNALREGDRIYGLFVFNTRTRKGKDGKDITTASVMAAKRSDLKHIRVLKQAADYFGFPEGCFETDNAWNERLVNLFADMYNKVLDDTYDAERDQIPEQPRDNLVQDDAPHASEFQSDASEDILGTRAEANAIARQAEALLGRTVPPSLLGDTQPPEWSDLPDPELAPHSPLAPPYDHDAHDETPDEPQPKYLSIEAALKDGMTMEQIHDEIAEDQMREPHEKWFPADIGRVSGKCPRSLTAAVKRGKQMKRRRGMPAPAEGFGDDE